LKGLVNDVYRHPLIHVHMDAEITDAAGYVGNFVTGVRSERGFSKIKHGAAVIAVGADEYKPEEYLYPDDDRVMTQLELEGRVAEADEGLLSAGSLVMIQCVGCRNEERNYCSRICCNQAVKNALKLKELNPGMDIYIFFRDMRTYGFREDYYREASNRDVRFVRFEAGGEPSVEAVEEEGRPVLRVSAVDPILGETLAVDADYLVLSAAVVPHPENKRIAQLFKVPLGDDKFFKEAHVKLRPVDFAAEGIYLCGTAHYPKHILETVNQAVGAAGRALTLLSHDVVTVSGSVCEVDYEKCVSCGACIAACKYNAISFGDTPEGKKAVVNQVICKGDGLCNAKCPVGAISLKHFTDQEILSQIDAAA
ncbi:MAG TPA: CoB--CoM heterodisulfide reductase iron-sulfur subunit A family protein, partial [Desulfobacteraceae bacterium]|nr:CoB--CoM heterodisulfide reductase iron-sulfur subunit A family protein [Desulfobacteraceae bacterium]